VVSIRNGSIFSSSKLDLLNALPLLYMWAADYDNRYCVRELGISANTVVEWFARFRNACDKYSHRMPKIGGPGRVVEFDQTCLVHQKHHRGAKKAGTQVWYAVGVERRLGYNEGRCFAVRVKRRDAATLDRVLTNYVAPGTTLLTDEWRATLNVSMRQLEQNWTHFVIRHKKETGGGFARWARIDDVQLAQSLGLQQNSHGNYWLRVHTNRCEGLNSHLKHKIKRLRGTALHYVQGYLAETVFRMNSRCLLVDPLEAFFKLVSFNDGLPEGEERNEPVEEPDGEEIEVIDDEQVDERGDEERQRDERELADELDELPDGEGREENREEEVSTVVG